MNQRELKSFIEECSDYTECTNNIELSQEFQDSNNVVKITAVYRRYRGIEHTSVEMSYAGEFMGRHFVRVVNSDDESVIVEAVSSAVGLLILDF
jgi:hypothetical protein